METAANKTGEEPRQRFEPLPWVLGAMLATMIAISISFLAVSLSFPDADVRAEPDALRAAASTSPPDASPEPGTEP